MGSGCGYVGRAVASDSRGPRFESSHWQHFILNIYYQLYRKDEYRGKEAGIGPFLKKTMWAKVKASAFTHDKHVMGSNPIIFTYLEREIH